MVNDKEVKTAVSPFAAREDEKKVYDGCYFKTSNSNLRIKRKVK